MCNEEPCPLNTIPWEGHNRLPEQLSGIFSRIHKDTERILS